MTFRNSLNIGLIACCLIFSGLVSAKKYYNSYANLVMAGYQGWFNTTDDGLQRGWRHLGGYDGFRPGSCNIDIWPDVSEYAKTYKTNFRFANGSVARVFSSADRSTIDTHFRWMKEYGIDGVFMQRFVAEIKNRSGLKHFNNVLDNAFSAANRYNRAICVMYDLSGMRAGDAKIVLADIDSLSRKYDLKNRVKAPTYLFENRKPLVCVWGVGFNDNRNYGLNDASQIINGLTKRGFSVMIGVPAHWRELSNDAVADAMLHKLIKRCDVLLPWFVGRYNEQTYSSYTKLITEDLKWCKLNNIQYVPLVYPGFSWKNMKGNNTIQIARNRGAFFWKQIHGALNAGCKTLYIAMFDEMDEGTAIFKAATEVPIGESRFIAIDKDLGSDYYLWLAGKAAYMLQNNIKISPVIPDRK
ncbi:MAG: glycoside hydrolase family 71/99-like protein [Bacteroidota bacterium]|nr:glycoside hydrolase family 71/99-like protein [Bacteroidota bacterium]